MNFADIASGSAVFLDANTLVYAFGPDPQLGPACDELLERIERDDLSGFTSPHVLSDTTHRLMTLEACATFGWPFAAIAQHLKRHPENLQKLFRYRQAAEAVIKMGVQVMPVAARNILTAATLSQQHGLLSNDALIVALMQENGLNQLASHDADFDRVPGITRFGPA